MSSIRVQNVKFFKPVRPRREQFVRADLSFRNVKDINLVKGLGIVVNAYCPTDKADYQYVVPMNNLEAITLVNPILFPQEVIENIEKEHEQKIKSKKSVIEKKNECKKS